MESTFWDLINKRKSVRTFDGGRLSDADRKKLGELLKNASNPFGADVDFEILDAKKHGLSSPVIVGAGEYLAAKVKRTGHYEIAIGYSFEKACLLALSLGVGTVMLAASLNRGAFEKALEVREDEVMPVASPLGYPAEKRSIRESLMRKVLKADERKPFGTLFFKGGFDAPLTEDEAGIWTRPLQALRLAPSATNGQPWRAVIDGSTVHFFEARSMRVSPLGDIQLMDVGIGLCHFDTVRREDGTEGAFEFCDPGIETPQNTDYVVSFVKE